MSTNIFTPTLSPQLCCSKSNLIQPLSYLFISSCNLAFVYIASKNRPFFFISPFLVFFLSSLQELCGGFRNEESPRGTAGRVLRSTIQAHAVLTHTLHAHTVLTHTLLTCTVQTQIHTQIYIQLRTHRAYMHRTYDHSLSLTHPICR